MQCTGAKILMECLVEQGVDTIFGYPGGTILNVYDELYNYEGDGRIKHILTAHEQGACHAADGYARSTGRVGVCFATSGPGCTNLVTGIATAYMDSSPIVCITCNVGTSLLGKDSFQEVDITGITMPITKCNYLVRSVDELADVVREAFAIARSGRPGPVLIDIPKNVTAEKADYEPLPRSTHGTSGRLGKLMKRSSQNFKAPEPDHRDIDKLVEMIAASKKPLLICGGGVVRARAHHEFEALANRIDSPVAITVMGAGGFRGRNPLTTGMIGMHGSQASNMAVDACDLLIAVGCRFSDRVALKPATFAQNAKIVQIDIDRSEINKNVQTDHHIIGDARRVLELLLERVPSMKHDDWKQYVFSFKTETEYDEADDHLTPQPGAFLPRQTHAAGYHRLYRRGSASDVGDSALPLRLSGSAAHLRRLWHHGLRLGRCHRRAGFSPGQGRPAHHRRRRLPHELQRAGNRAVLQSADYQHRIQQRHAGHGSPVADADL